MPATQFICPDGNRVPILQCLQFCPQGERCMFLPTLRAIAKSLHRDITEPTVTELIAGVGLCCESPVCPLRPSWTRRSCYT